MNSSVSSCTLENRIFAIRGVPWGNAQIRLLQAAGMVWGPDWCRNADSPADPPAPDPPALGRVHPEAGWKEAPKEQMRLK